MVLVVSIAGGGAGALAQPTPEAEPNDTAAAANLAVVTPTRPITGTSTGGSGINGSVNSPDWFRVRINATPTLVQQHRLQLSSPRPGHTGVLGVTRFGEGAVEGQVNAFQFTSVNTTPARFNQFYTFGVTQADVLLRVSGSNATTDPYTVTLTTTPVTFSTLSPIMLAGPITVTTESAGHTTDTELFVFDMTTGALVAQCDNAITSGGGATAQSRVTFQAVAYRRYLIAASTADTASSMANDPLIDAVTAGTLAPSPGLLISASTAATADLSMNVQGNWQGTTVSDRVTLARPGPYGVAFTSVYFPCGIADVAGPGQSALPDGELTADDVIVYIDQFVGPARTRRADVATGGEQPGVDGQHTADDLILFIRAFVSGCP